MKKIKEGYEFDDWFKEIMNLMEIGDLDAMYKYGDINPLLIKDGRIVGYYDEKGRRDGI